MFFQHFVDSTAVNEVGAVGYLIEKLCMEALLFAGIKVKVQLHDFVVSTYKLLYSLCISFLFGLRSVKV